MFSTGLREPVLIVDDVHQVADFCCDVVCLTPGMEVSDDWPCFWAGEPGGQRLALHKGSLLFEELSPHPDGKRWGHVDFALEVAGAELHQAVARVQEQGAGNRGR
jgi:hypothetical protein